MHEESLGSVIRDYLTGEELAETSYEEFRQALARMLVEELGYPKAALAAKVGVCFPVDGREYTRMVDLVAFGPDGAPLLLVVCLLRGARVLRARDRGRGQAAPAARAPGPGSRTPRPPSSWPRPRARCWPRACGPCPATRT